MLLCVRRTGAPDLLLLLLLPPPHELHNSPQPHRHMDGAQTQWTGKSHQQRSSCTPPPPPPLHAALSSSSLPPLILSSLAFFFLLNLTGFPPPTPPHPFPSWCEPADERERSAIRTTLSRIVLRCLAVAAITDDRLRGLFRVRVYPSEEEVAGEGRRGRREDGGRQPLNTTIWNVIKKEKGSSSQVTGCWRGRMRGSVMVSRPQRAALRGSDESH